MKKRYLIFPLIGILLSSFFSISCFAEDKDEKISNITLTLETAIGIIESNNPNIKALDGKIVIAEKQYKDDSNKQNKAFIKDPMGRTSVLDIKKQQEINWRKSLLNFKSMRYQRKEKLRSLNIEVEKMYIEATALQNDVKSYEEELSIINKKFEESTLRVKLGYLKQSDIKPIEAQKIQLNSRIALSKNNLDNTMLKLKRALGLDDKTSLYIEPLNYDLLELDDSDIDAKIQEAVKASYDVISKKEELDILTLDKKLTQKYSFIKNDSMMDSINMNIQDKEEECDNAAYNLETSLLSSYYNLKVLQNNVEFEKLNLESAEADLKAIQSKVSIGVANKIEELSKANTISKQKNVLQRSINTYTIASHDLESKLTIDVDKK